MTDQKLDLRARLKKLRTDPRVAPFSIIGPGGQVFDLVGALIDAMAVQIDVDELRAQLRDEVSGREAACRQLDRQAAELRQFGDLVQRLRDLVDARDGLEASKDARIAVLEGQLKGVGALMVNKRGS